MAQRSQVPKFGNWESEEIPYTICFDNATKKGKKTIQIDQLDIPQVNTEAEWNERKKTPQPKTPKHERHSSRENNYTRSGSDQSEAEILKPKHQEEGHETKKYIDSPLRQGRNSSNSSPRHHQHGGLTPRIAGRLSAGSDRSADHSPHHPKSGGNKISGISSPSWERKEGNHGLAPSTPGRSRLRSVTRGDDSPDRGPAVPKFGDWDETDPSSAEGYTQIFNRVREEKNSDTGKVPVMPNETHVPNGHKQYGNDNPKGCGCFPWAR